MAVNTNATPLELVEQRLQKLEDLAERNHESVLKRFEDLEDRLWRRLDRLADHFDSADSSFMRGLEVKVNEATASAIRQCELQKATDHLFDEVRRLRADINQNNTGLVKRLSSQPDEDYPSQRIGAMQFGQKAADPWPQPMQQLNTTTSSAPAALQVKAQDSWPQPQRPSSPGPATLWPKQPSQGQDPWPGLPSQIASPAPTPPSWTSTPQGAFGLSASKSIAGRPSSANHMNLTGSGMMTPPGSRNPAAGVGLPLGLAEYEELSQSPNFGGNIGISSNGTGQLWKRPASARMQPALEIGASPPELPQQALQPGAPTRASDVFGRGGTIRVAAPQTPLAMRGPPY